MPLEIQRLVFYNSPVLVAKAARAVQFKAPGKGVTLMKRVFWFIIRTVAMTGALLLAMSGTAA